MSKLYKCIYCNEKFDREELVEHLEDEHDELLPEGYTPVHMVFDIVNNKKIGGGGVCVVCKRETAWSDTNEKYDRLCTRKQCSDILRESYKKNMLKVHGKITLLDDPDHQARMLSNRKISGKYKFEDGGYHIYTGTYEQKCLEFLDKVMGFKSTDILAPGPTIEYEYQNMKHAWITDFMLIPYNLIIEVKDGGDNPNNRQMEDYRAKQTAKEVSLSAMGKHSYLRLVNNDFSQLLETLAEIKMQMIDDSEDNKKVVININEEVEALRELAGMRETSCGILRETRPYSFLEVLEEAVKLQKVSDKDWKDILTIHDSLSSKEKKFLGGRFINSPNTAFTKVYREGPEPIAFVQGYDFGKSELIIELAVVPHDRGRGYGKRCVSECVAFARRERYDRVVYLVKINNTDSIALAKKSGFKCIEEEHGHYIYTLELVKVVKESSDNDTDNIEYKNTVRKCGKSQNPYERESFEDFLLR